MKDSDTYGVDLTGLLTAEDAKTLSKSSAKELRDVLIDILSFVKKKANDVVNPGRTIRYNRNGFGNSVWGENQAAICNLLRQLGYVADRHEEYQQFVDVSLHVSW
jgi:hypothetical protein